jgi:energy-coupling factor transporter transmembrane protein EcfT
MVKTRLKFFGLFGISTAMILIRNPVLICLVSIVIFSFSFSVIQYSVFIKRLRPIIVIGLFIMVYQLVFLSSISIYQRLYDGLMQSVKLMSLSLLVFVFTETTSITKIVTALSFLPKKVCLLITISFALIPAIMREISDIRIAQQARGFAPRGFNIIRSILPILIPLLNRTLMRAEHIAIVLETRGFE